MPKARFSGTPLCLSSSASRSGSEVSRINRTLRRRGCPFETAPTSWKLVSEAVVYADPFVMAKGASLQVGLVGAKGIHHGILHAVAKEGVDVGGTAELESGHPKAGCNGYLHASEQSAVLFGSVVNTQADHRLPGLTGLGRVQRFGGSQIERGLLLVGVGRIVILEDVLCPTTISGSFSSSAISL